MQEKLQSAWKHLESLWYKPHYLAIYGSQNYGLDVYDSEYTSDIDYKCVIIPTLNDLVRNSKPLSKVIEFDWGQIDIKDIRSYVESVVKCNVNFLEILGTDHYICENWSFLREYLKPLMQEMWQFYLKACYWMMLEKYEALRHPYPSTIAKIERFWYDPKQLHHILRLRSLMQRYISGNFPNFIHTDDEQDALLQIKKWFVKDEIVDQVADWEIELAKCIRDRYDIIPVFDTKNQIIEKSYSIIHESICKSMN